MHGSGPMTKEDEVKFLKERSQQIVLDQQKQEERRIREEKIKAINQRKREEKEAAKLAERKARIKPPSTKKPKVEKPKVEKENAEATPKKEKVVTKKVAPQK